MTAPIRTLVGSRLRSHRKAKRITQAQVAEVLNCEMTTISRYERGERAPDAEQLVKLATFFGISPIDLLPTEVEIRIQTISELRSALLELVFRIEDPAELQRLITAAKSPQAGYLR